MRVAARFAFISSFFSRSVAFFLCLVLFVSPLDSWARPAAHGQNDADSSATASSKKKSKTRKQKAKPTAKKKSAPASRESRAARTARTAKIHQAFVLSGELRPMAQQLATLRTPTAYAAVTSYARQHSGEAAAAAYLALGHAFALDGKYAEAAEHYRLARKNGEALADYADYLAAQAENEAGNHKAAEDLLRGFQERYPDSIFHAREPELEASVLVALNDAAGAQRLLRAAAGSDAADRPGFQLAQAEVAQSLGDSAEAERLYKQLLLAHPLASEAEKARVRLQGLGAALSLAELRSLGDAWYNAGRYGQAAEQYHALAHSAALDAAARNGFAVAEAACDLKLKRLTTAQAEALADSDGEAGARRAYLLMELARNRDDAQEQQRIVDSMQSRFPNSQWLAEALFSSGNMYLLSHDYPRAVKYYAALASRFPNHKNAAAAHWKAAWLNYRMGQYEEAARLFEEQVKRFSGSKEVSAALYWRARLYETQEHQPSLAAANYRTIMRVYPHYYYAQMAHERLEAMGNIPAAHLPHLDTLQPPPAPQLDGSFPADSPHLAKARLLANAGLNDYIAEEIAADPNSANWGALAEARIYASFGENWRAMRALKRAVPNAASTQIASMPLAYWHILFPQPWWTTIQQEAARNNMDPYLVAAQIRQESEFNPNAVSHANAMGLMQLLPAAGRQIAREEGISGFQPYQLFNPEMNIRLGTRYMRNSLDKFGNHPEYALAAYDAGDSRVADWQAAGPYSGMDEFVESIPFTETREYVQSILRNREMYRAIDQYARNQEK
jgi:soluble lytic murein transglycosylase